MLPRGVAFKISRTFKLPEENPWQNLDLQQINSRVVQKTVPKCKTMPD